MAQITYYAPAGVTSINLSDGSVKKVVDGKFEADSSFRPELERAGFSGGGVADVMSTTNRRSGKKKFSAGKDATTYGEPASLGYSVVPFSGAISLVTANPGEAVSIVDLAGEKFARCVVSTTASALFGAEYVLPEQVYIGHCETLQIPVYFNSQAAEQLGSGVIQLWIYEVSSGTSVRPQLSLDTLRPGEVNLISFSRDSLISGATPITQFDVDRINKIRIYITAGSAPSATAEDRAFYVGPIRAGQRRKGRVVWYLDGEYDSQHKYILPMMDALGIKATMPLVNSNIGLAGYMTEAQTLGARERGHLLCHHTFGSATGGYGNAAQWPTEDSIYNDIQATWAWLSARGAIEGIGHAVVGHVNYWTPATAAIAGRDAMIKSAMSRAGVKTLRRGGTFLAQGSGVGMLTSLQDARQSFLPMTGGIQITNTTTAAQVQAVIDAAEARGELANIVLHKGVLDTAAPAALEMKLADIAQILDYAADRERVGGVYNQTIAEVYEDCADNLT